MLRCFVNRAVSPEEPGAWDPPADHFKLVGSGGIESHHNRDSKKDPHDSILLQKGLQHPKPPNPNPNS